MRYPRIAHSFDSHPAIGALRSLGLQSLCRSIEDGASVFGESRRRIRITLHRIVRHSRSSSFILVAARSAATPQRRNRGRPDPVIESASEQAGVEHHAHYETARKGTLTALSSHLYSRLRPWSTRAIVPRKLGSLAVAISIPSATRR